MSSHAWLHTLRAGSVRYLNARPLTEAGRGQFIPCHPTELAQRFERGELDLALMPAFFLLRHPRHPIADGIAIASDGPVYSVFVAHRRPMEEIRTITLDPASSTSAHLIRCLLPDREFVEASTGVEPEAQLLIGDQALEFRQQDRAGAYQYFDLGAEWQRRFQLPFVYAAWIIRADLPDVPAIAAHLRDLQAESLAQRRRIAATQTLLPADLCTRYLSEHIRYELGPREKQGLELFRARLEAERLLPVDAPLLRFV